MIRATCISVIRNDQYEAVGYTIKSKDRLMKIKVEPLKQAIQRGKLRVVGLEVNSEGEIVYLEDRYKSRIAKAKLFNIDLYKIPTECGHTCYLFEESNQTHVVYIPPDVLKLNVNWLDLTFTKHIQKLPGTIKVVGGCGLISISHMFRECRAETLDLLQFDTSNVRTMLSLFWDCRAQEINMSNLDTHNVTNMGGMFGQCKAKTLDFSSFDTSEVTNMGYMFDQAETPVLDLSNFDTRKVTNMEHMFDECKSKTLNLSSFNTSSLKEFWGIFWNCKADIETSDLKLLEASKKR